MNETGNGESNKPTINWVTRTICTMGLLFSITLCILSFFGKPMPPELVGPAGIVIGGLLSMLTKSTPTPSVPTAETKAPIEKKPKT